ncbi:MAG: DUF2905 domain-containing protein [Chloroflexi bacterium]|jgi:hypothetical protein|nr:DUF2905 domain-containing protein [Anaerolineaceae bacterium]NMB89747.1 DUF2905 domain-containing protein [Chloroflexota bacterium]
MDGLDAIGKWLIIAGLVLAVTGGIVWLLGRLPGLTQLPGTLRIEGQGVTCVFPILASIVLSIVLTVILNLVARLLNR